MSGYAGRRAPNFSQYLDDLNAIPSPYDQSLQQQQNDPLNLDAELALFTNTEFFDFGHFGDMNMPLTYDPADDETNSQDKEGAEKNHNVNYMDLLNVDLNHMPEYPSTDYNQSDSQDMQMTPSFPTVPQAHNGTFNNGASPLDKVAPLTSLTPTERNVTSTGASPVEAPTPSQTAGTKRKPSQHDAKSPDDSAKVAAEEDKRRRNTAASARFRVKKKQREQALERTVKEASDKNAVLEARVSQLELENKWLKNLITEKNGEATDGEKNEVDIAQMFKKFLANQKIDGQRNLTGSKIGVGTSG